MPSSRQFVMDYLWGRTLAAWDRRADEEAQQCARFLASLEGMTDQQFIDAYEEEPEQEAVA